MIIFNTTYHADHSRKDEFISWLKNFYIPAVLEHGGLQEPQLTRIFAENEEAVSYTHLTLPTICSV